MNKPVLLISVCVVVLSIISLVVVLTSGNKSGFEGDAIMQKETALQIGRALLEEHFPDTFLNNDIPIEAEEKDGIWRVNNIVEREGVTEDGQIMIVKGGVLYVEFRKDNGKVIKIGIDD